MEKPPKIVDLRDFSEVAGARFAQCHMVPLQSQFSPPPRRGKTMLGATAPLDPAAARRRNRDRSMKRASTSCRCRPPRARRVRIRTSLLIRKSDRDLRSRAKRYLAAPDFVGIVMQKLTRLELLSADPPIWLGQGLSASVGSHLQLTRRGMASGLPAAFVTVVAGGVRATSSRQCHPDGCSRGPLASASTQRRIRRAQSSVRGEPARVRPTEARPTTLHAMSTTRTAVERRQPAERSGK